MEMPPQCYLFYNNLWRIDAVLPARRSLILVEGPRFPSRGFGWNGVHPSLVAASPSPARVRDNAECVYTQEGNRQVPLCVHLTTVLTHAGSFPRVAVATTPFGSLSLQLHVDT